MILFELGTVICLEIIIINVWTYRLHDVCNVLLDVAPSCSVQPATPSLMTLGGLGLKEGNILCLIILGKAGRIVKNAESLTW